MASIADLAERGLIRWHQRDLLAGDLDASWLVYAATGDDTSDADVVDRAAARQRFCLPGSGGVGAPEHAGRKRLGGRVVLVGGGPGDPGLITVTGRTAIREADVIVHDRLAPLAVLDEVRRGAVIIDVSKIPGGATTPQEEINRVLIEYAAAGKSVVRLKGGDNFVFGRGGEEWQACVAAGIEVQIVPGVSSALAVPALAGIPLTHRTANHGFTIITGHVPPGDPRSMLDYAALARSRTALVIMMGVGNLAAIADELIAQGLDPRTPAATIADGSMPGQRTVASSLAEIGAATAAAGVRPPAITVIGSVAAFDPRISF
jgi:uroporphyrin-III C-methyltransferase